MLNWPALRQLIDSAPSRRVVTVAGAVAESNPDQQDNEGARHQILIMRVEKVLAARKGRAPVSGDMLYVAIRFGDQEGLDKPIPAVTVGSPIVVRGAYIPPEQAHDRTDVGRIGVLHFTHRPVGWVDYGGRRYD